MAGKFITLEGGEGAGKSTQAELLAGWLQAEGLSVVETREPGGTPGADAIRNLLLNNSVELTAYAEAHLFAAARADHLETLIRPALARGDWVVCDRYIDSSLAYQGAAGALSIALVRRINELAIGETWPDLTLLLRTEPGLGAQRALERDGENSDRFSERDTTFHTAVARGFDELAGNEPDRFAIVDASDNIDGVAAEIRRIVQERLL